MVDRNGRMMAGMGGYQEREDDMDRVPAGRFRNVLLRDEDDLHREDFRHRIHQFIHQSLGNSWSD